MKKQIFITILILTLFTLSACSISTSQENKISTDRAKELILEAFEKVFYILVEAELENVDNVEYRIIDEKINSKQKIISFLEDVYTRETANHIYDTLLIEEREGDIFVPISDYIITGWREIEVAKITYGNNNTASVLVEFKDTGAEYEVKLRYVENQWFVDQIVI